MADRPELPDWHGADEGDEPAVGEPELVEPAPTQALPTVVVPTPTAPPLPPPAPPPPPITSRLGPSGTGRPPDDDQRGSPWPWVLGGLALALVIILLVASALRDAGDGGDPTATTAAPTTTAGTGSSRATSTSRASTTTTEAPSTTAASTTTSAPDRSGEALAFARREVARCAEETEAVPEDRATTLTAVPPADRARQRYGVVDGVGNRLVADLTQSKLTGPGGPADPVPPPYDRCSSSSFVGGS